MLAKELIKKLEMNPDAEVFIKDPRLESLVAVWWADIITVERYQKYQGEPDLVYQSHRGKTETSKEGFLLT